MQGLSTSTILNTLPILGLPLGAIGLVLILRTPSDVTQDREISLAINNAVRTDCSTFARRESNKSGDRIQRMKELMEGCDGLVVESISIRGRLGKPVAKVELRATKQPVPANFNTRYYKLHSRIITWTASRTSALSYNLKLF